MFECHERKFASTFCPLPPTPKSKWRACLMLFAASDLFCGSNVVEMSVFILPLMINSKKALHNDYAMI